MLVHKQPQQAMTFKALSEEQQQKNLFKVCLRSFNAYLYINYILHKQVEPFNIFFLYTLYITNKRVFDVYSIANIRNYEQCITKNITLFFKQKRLVQLEVRN